jgi:tetratricopeptide (TPR) repeat protein
MQKEVSHEFVASLHAGLTFWREQLDRRSIAELDLERHNLYRAVELGLSLPGTLAAAAEVAAATFNFILARGYRAEWLALMESAATGFPAEPTEARFWLLTRLGQLRRLNHRLQQSIDMHEQALDIARQIGEPVLVAEGHYHLGRAQRDAHLSQQANEHLQKAVEILEEVEAEYAQRLTGLVVNALGRVAYDQGQFGEARLYLERSVVIARALQRSYPLSERLLDLANLYRAIGLNEEALAAYEESLSLLPESQYPLDRLQVQHSIGALHFSCRDYAGAEQTFRGLDWAFLRETGNLTEQAQLTNSLGNSVLYQQRYDEAAEILQQAVVLWQELGDDLELANSTGSVGEALAGMGAKEEAAEMFDRALRLLDQYPESGPAAQLRTFFVGEQAKLAEQEEGAGRIPAPPVAL